MVRCSNRAIPFHMQLDSLFRVANRIRQMPDGERKRNLIRISKEILEVRCTLMEEARRGIIEVTSYDSEIAMTALEPSP